jgi:ferredoxin hydrogenase large subunit/hydrogenase large subunit
MAAQSILIDPITRIEGHLSIRVQVDQGRVTSAESIGESFRGFEAILRGRKPLDAQYITQRICGVCPVEHAIASVLAQDAAYGITPPTNGRLIRNIVAAANFIQSNILHFYTLSAIDFIDVTAVLKYQGQDPALGYLKGWVQSELRSTNYYPAAPFLPRMNGDYAADPELNLGALRHYIQALELRSEASKLGALLGGKLPHVASIIPGGATIRVGGRIIADCISLIQRLRDFIERCYIPDVLAVASAYSSYYGIGAGPGNYLAFGVFHEDAAGTNKLLPSGVLTGGVYSALDQSRITEDVGCSWFSSGSGQHPLSGDTTPAPDKAGAYSWIKAPRYNGHVMEVGPLARVLIAYQSGTNPALTAQVDALLLATGRSLGELNSVMGRHAARAVETKIIADRCEQWLEQLTADAIGFTPFTIPSSCQGIGLTEAARGALGHWMQVSGGVISRYQCVVPTTWNASPRDDRGQPGAMEQALVGTPVADPTSPVETVRVVRSFDPCLSCAVH